MPVSKMICSPWGPVDRSCWRIPDGTTEETIAKYTLIASQLLFRLSGSQYGPSCPVTVRPCRQRCDTGRGWTWNLYGLGALYGSPWIPYIGVDGAWRNASICGCNEDCSCGELCRISLPGPVFDIVSVVDGTLTLPSNAYRVDNGTELIRTDGNCWPDCQNQTAACGTAGSLCVTYRVGLPLDELALFALSSLVEHYIIGCAGCGCGMSRLDNVTRVQRQGVTMEMLDPSTLRQDGLTGISIVDEWLSAVNPYRLTAKPRVLSPDFRRPRATTWP